MEKRHPDKELLEFASAVSLGSINELLEKEKPKRIQRKRTKGFKMPPNTVYVGRPTKWGNPYPVGDNFSPQSALNHYKEFVKKWDLAEDAKAELRNKNLACWCRVGEPCHADVLLEIANS